MQGFGQESAKYMRDLTEKEERAAFGKRLKRKEVWTAEYRLKHDTATLTRGTAASTKRLHKYSRLEAANTGHQSYSLMKSRAQDTAPALEAPDTEHIGGLKSRAGIKFRRNERSIDGGIPQGTGHKLRLLMQLASQPLQGAQDKRFHDCVAGIVGMDTIVAQSVT